MNESKNSNLAGQFVPFLVVLLIIVSFFAGGLWTKLKNSESVKGSTTSQSQTQNQTSQNQTQTPTALTADGKEGTFSYKNDTTLCKQGEKPIVYLFSTTWCPHCEWVKDTFDKVAKEYVSAGKIIAYHWELDTGDDTLTSDVEKAVPGEAQAVYSQFNPEGSIPTYVIGCKYWRIGNGHEQQSDLAAEEQEFRTIFDKILSES